MSGILYVGALANPPSPNDLANPWKSPSTPQVWLNSPAGYRDIFDSK